MPHTLKNYDLAEFLDCATSAAIEAGRFLVSKMGTVSVQEKNPGDFVTQADIESQNRIKNMILERFPDHDFLGEEADLESQQSNGGKSDFCWIVDPLDGTTNFIHQLRSFSVSIALRYRNEMIVGCVHDPLLDETYTAARGLGAHLNGQEISTSRHQSVKKALIVCSLPKQLTRESVELQHLVNVLCDSESTLRRLGSAALNMCYIACGRMDAYWSTQAAIWDIAAGLVIMEEAGGNITGIERQELDWSNLRFVASASDSLSQELVLVLNA